MIDRGRPNRQIPSPSALTSSLKVNQKKIPLVSGSATGEAVGGNGDRAGVLPWMCPGRVCMCGLYRGWGVDRRGVAQVARRRELMVNDMQGEPHRSRGQEVVVIV